MPRLHPAQILTCTLSADALMALAMPRMHSALPHEDIGLQTRRTGLSRMTLRNFKDTGALILIWEESRL